MPIDYINNDSEMHKLHVSHMANIQDDNTAPIIANRLYNAILEFQNNLQEEYDVILALANFGKSTTIVVNNVGYIGYSLIVFHGEDSCGNPLELIQNVNQLDFLITAQRKQDPETPKRKIGFLSD